MARNSYQDIYELHQRHPKYKDVFTSVMLCQWLELGKLSEARSYISWALSHDLIRETMNDGVSCYYQIPIGRKWLIKKWHPNSILPNDYWNGATDRSKWFDHLWIEEALQWKEMTA